MTARPDIERLHQHSPLYVRDLCTYALALEARVAEKVWQPIETAPRDGTEILMWSTSLGAAVWTAKAAFDDVTHWMPLPPPPTETDR